MLNTNEQLKTRLVFVGAPKVGKRMLVENFICKYFNGRKVEDKTGEYVAKMITNVGAVELSISIMTNFDDVNASFELDKRENSCYIIVSDVSDKNMHVLFKKWYDDITQCLGEGCNLFMVNCFNKTDIHNIPTYIFDSSVPTFDVSARTTSGIDNMLTFILRRLLKRDDTLIMQ